MGAPDELPYVLPLAMERPLSPLRAFADRHDSFLLHGGHPMPGGRQPRWSFFGVDPFAVFRAGEYDAAVETIRRMAARAPRGRGRIP